MGKLRLESLLSGRRAIVPHGFLLLAFIFMQAQNGFRRDQPALTSNVRENQVEAEVR